MGTHMSFITNKCACRIGIPLSTRQLPSAMTCALTDRFYLHRQAEGPSREPHRKRLHERSNDSPRDVVTTQATRFKAYVRRAHNGYGFSKDPVRAYRATTTSGRYARTLRLPTQRLLHLGSTAPEYGRAKRGAHFVPSRCSNYRTFKTMVYLQNACYFRPNMMFQIERCKSCTCHFAIVSVRLPVFCPLACENRRLSCRCLPGSSAQNIPNKDFFDQIRFDSCPRHGRTIWPS